MITPLHTDWAGMNALPRKPNWQLCHHSRHYLRGVVRSTAMILLSVINAIQWDFFPPTCSFRRLQCQVFKTKMFCRRERIWQRCWPTSQKQNENYRGQIPASGNTVNTYAVNEVVKSTTGTSNFHNQNTPGKWILSYPVTSLSSWTKVFSAH